MPPKGSGADYRIRVDKKERARGVTFQVRLLARDGSSLHGPLRETTPAALADRRRVERASDGRAELRRLRTEHAQAGGRRDLAAATFRDALAWHDDHGRWPRRCTSRKGPEAVLAQRWHRWGMSTKLTPAAQSAKARIDALAQAERESRLEDERAEGAEQALLMLHQHWREGNDVHDEDRWRQPALHRSSGGQRPYPGLSNLRNTCYLNAPLQCLIHCPAARAALLGAEGEDEPLELRALATACARGVPPSLAEGDGGEARARLRVDRWSPHALVEALIAKHRFEYKLGRCADASGALLDMIQDAPSLHSLFHITSSNGDEEVAMRLPYFVDGAHDGDDAISPQEFMSIAQGTQKLNMRELIRRGTSMRALATKPAVLAVYVDPRWGRGGTLFYMSGIGILPDWGDVPEVALQ
ncbi:unnamed protein product, partial [Prorocentrum cordatum]